MEILGIIAIAGVVIVNAIPVAIGLTKSSRKKKALAKASQQRRNPLSDDMAKKSGKNKYLSKTEQKTIGVNIKTNKKIELNIVVNSMFNPQEDILLKGTLHDKSKTASGEEEVIYLYQPAIRIFGKLVKPRVVNGNLCDDAVYIIRDGEEVYTFYVDKREASSGLPFDFVPTSQHGKRDTQKGLSIQLDFKVVNLNNEQEKKEYEEYIEKRKKDGLDNRDRYQAKIDNCAILALTYEIEKKFAEKEVSNRGKKTRPTYVNQEIENQKRSIELTQRMNDLKRAGIVNEHGDHYDINGGSDSEDRNFLGMSK